MDEAYLIPVQSVLAWQDGVGGVIGADGAGGGGTTSATGAPAGPTTNGAARGADPFGSMILPLMLGFLVLMVVTTMMSGRREKREKKQLMESLKRHDTVQLSGGMIGTVTEIHPNEVVVRVDDTTKTSIRFVKSAIVTVVKPAGGSSEGSGEAGKESKKSTPEAVTA